MRPDEMEEYAVGVLMLSVSIALGIAAIGVAGMILIIAIGRI